MASTGMASAGLGNSRSRLPPAPYVPALKRASIGDTTQNLMIEGDNLEGLKLLQKSYTGKVKLIYIDPPYNTGKCPSSVRHQNCLTSAPLGQIEVIA